MQRAARGGGLPGAAARPARPPAVPGAEAQVPLTGVVLRRPDPQHLQHQVEELIRDGAAVEKDELAHQRAPVALLLRLSRGRQLQVQVLGARLFGENREGE